MEHDKREKPTTVNNTRKAGTFQNGSQILAIHMSITTPRKKVHLRNCQIPNDETRLELHTPILHRVRPVNGGAARPRMGRRDSGPRPGAYACEGRCGGRVCMYRRSGPEARRRVPHSRRRALPASDFCRICKKRCEERRGEILAWGQGDAGGRGEGNHLMRRRSWLQEHRREKQGGGGDPGGGVLLTES